MQWIIDDGRVYCTDANAFLDKGSPNAQVLYKDCANPDALVRSDVAFLRETVLFHGYALGEELKTSLDRVHDIQAIYAPKLAALQSAKVGAEMRDATDTVAEIKTEYTALLAEMRTKIEGVSRV